MCDGLKFTFKYNLNYCLLLEFPLQFHSSGIALKCNWKTQGLINPSLRVTDFLNHLFSLPFFVVS